MPKSKRREPLSFEQLKATFAEFQAESDRAAAILSVALLDAQLEEILTAFGADEHSLAELLRPDQPIGSLSARRRLCLALGLISPEEAAELSILGKIRNEFAHRLAGQGFDNRPIVGWVQSLKVPQRVLPRAKFQNRCLASVKEERVVLASPLGADSFWSPPRWLSRPCRVV
jgi:DNA-binding MltR family transcriptional regulator